MKTLFNILATTLVVTSNIVVPLESSFAALAENSVRTFSNPSSKLVADTDSAKKQKAEEDAQRQKKREEAAEIKRKKAEEAAAIRAKKQEEAALNKKKAAELAAERKKQQEEASLAKKKKAEDLAVERKKQQEEASLARKKKAEELAAERKKQQEDDSLVRKKKAEDLAAERKKQQEEASLARKKKAEELATEQQKKRDEIACRNVEVRGNGNRNREFSRNTTLRSCKYKLHFQGDGNLVLIDPSGKVIWATGTEGRATKLALQTDGNVVLYDKQAKALWATNTDKNPGAFFALQRDGNFVVYNGSNPIWATNTSGGRFTTVSAASIWQGSGNQTVTQSPSKTKVQPSQPSQTSSQPIAPLTSLNPALSDCHLGGACYFRTTNPSIKHTGVDYFINAGSNVRSICDGVVELSKTDSTNEGTIWNSFVIVRYRKCGGYDTIYAYYGHLNSQVSEGKDVKRGQTIGNIQDLGDNSHLHFGLATVKFDGNPKTDTGWGYQKKLNAKGWIDPDDFASKYRD